MSNTKLRIYHRLFAFFGISLVSPLENAVALKCNKFVSILYVGMSILLLAQKSLDISIVSLPYLQVVCNWIVWCTLFFCYALLLYVVTDIRRFLRQNWLLPCILIVGVGLLVRSHFLYHHLIIYRHLLALIVFLPTLQFVVPFFLDGRLWTTLVAALVIIVFFGFFVASIDPGIPTIEDGVWWAVATVSTVGYGDIVPVSLMGRFIGGILVFVGLGMFVVITANFLSIMLRNEAHNKFTKDDTSDQLLTILDNQAKINKRLTKLQGDIDQLK